MFTNNPHLIKNKINILEESLKPKGELEIAQS